MPNNNQTIEILKLRKITINSISIEASFVTNIEIYESLTQPGITGFIQIKDYQALQELGNVFADDPLEISFYVDEDESNEITLKMKIFTNEGSRQLALNTYDFLRLGFCSPWLVDGLGKTVSKAYSKKLVSEIVEDLLKECGAEIGYIEPTKTRLESFVTPLWTPYHSIKYLSEFAMNGNKQGGYLCWTDLKTGKVNFATLNYLLSGSLGTYKTFQVYTDNIRYSGRVRHMNIESNYDSIRMINNGVPETKYYSFDYNTKSIITTEKSISDIPIARLGRKFPILSKYSDKKYIKHKFTPLFHQTAEKPEDENKDMIEGRESTTYSFLTSDVIKINIETIGEMNRRVGWLAELDYPSAAANAGETGNKTGHRQYKGLYLIREIKHEFSLFDDYRQYITLVSDGFKEMDLDLITWSK